jgi:hypothetical protein
LKITNKWWNYGHIINNLWHSPSIYFHLIFEPWENGNDICSFILSVLESLDWWVEDEHVFGRGYLCIPLGMGQSHTGNKRKWHTMQVMFWGRKIKGWIKKDALKYHYKHDFGGQPGGWGKTGSTDHLRIRPVMPTILDSAHTSGTFQ